MIAEEPAATGDGTCDARLGGMAEGFAWERDVPVPAWTAWPLRFLGAPCFSP
jgi:hypothetical protein